LGLVCVGVPALCLFFLFCLRLLHAGGSLKNIEMSCTCSSFLWTYDSKKDHAYRHPLSPNSVVHDVLTVTFKCAAVLVSAFFGRKHNTEMVAFMLAISLALVYTTLRWPPHRGTDGSSGHPIVITSNANRTRCALDVTLILMFAYALMVSVNYDHSGKVVSWWNFLIGIVPAWIFGFFALPNFVFGTRTLQRSASPTSRKLCYAFCCHRTKKVHPTPVADDTKPRRHSNKMAEPTRPRAATMFSGSPVP
jgi:hypothetical protein